MKKGLLFVALALISAAALNGCCRCKKEMMTESTVPVASGQAAPAQAQTSQPGSSGYSSYNRAIK